MTESKHAANNAEQKQIKVSLSPEIAQGKYANLMLGNFSKEEFILDFGMLFPQAGAATIHSRVVLTPRNAKKLLSILTTQLKEYETKCGPISDDKSPGGPIKLSFN